TFNESISTPACLYNILYSIHYQKKFKNGITVINLSHHRNQRAYSMGSLDSIISFVILICAQSSIIVYHYKNTNERGDL
ncbi:MAG: hypothetical protein JSV97_13045, partial [candidate division WOR-3 bacterium]